MRTRQDTCMKRRKPAVAAKPSKQLKKTLEPIKEEEVSSSDSESSMTSDSNTDVAMDLDLFDTDNEAQNEANLKADSDAENQANYSDDEITAIEESYLSKQDGKKTKSKDKVKKDLQLGSKTNQKAQTLERKEERKSKERNLIDMTTNHGANHPVAQAQKAPPVQTNSPSFESELFRLTQAFIEKHQAKQREALAQQDPWAKAQNDQRPITLKVDQDFSIGLGPQHVPPRNGACAYTYQAMTFNKLFKSGKSYCISTTQRHMVPLIQQLVPHASQKYPGKTNRFLLEFMDNTLMPHLKEVFVDSSEHHMPQDVKEHLIKLHQQLTDMVPHLQQREKTQKGMESQQPPMVQWSKQDGLAGVSGLLEALQQTAHSQQQ